MDSRCYWVAEARPCCLWLMEVIVKEDKGIPGLLVCMEVEMRSNLVFKGANKLKLDPDNKEVLLLEGTLDQLGGNLPGLDGVTLPPKD